MSITSRIKAFFSGKKNKKPLLTSSVSKAESLVNKLLEKNAEELKTEVSDLDDCLILLEHEVLRIQKLSKKSARRGDVYFDGAALSEICRTLAIHLADKNLISQEAKVTNLWTGAVLSVNAHYHHLVGPAMIANAKISERTNNLEYAKKAYDAVIQDFRGILDYVQDDEYRPCDEELISIESLNEAVCRLIKIESSRSKELLELKDRISSVLSKEDDPERIFGPVEVSVNKKGRILCPGCNWNGVYRPDKPYCSRCGLEFIVC